MNLELALRNRHGIKVKEDKPKPKPQDDFYSLTGILI